MPENFFSILIINKHGETFYYKQILIYGVPVSRQRMTDLACSQVERYCQLYLLNFKSIINDDASCE